MCSTEESHFPDLLGPQVTGASGSISKSHTNLLIWSLVTCTCGPYQSSRALLALNCQALPGSSSLPSPAATCSLQNQQPSPPTPFCLLLFLRDSPGSHQSALLSAPERWLWQLGTPADTSSHSLATGEITLRFHISNKHVFFTTWSSLLQCVLACSHQKLQTVRQRQLMSPRVWNVPDSD